MFGKEGSEDSGDDSAACTQDSEFGKEVLERTGDDSAACKRDSEAGDNPLQLSTYSQHGVFEGDEQTYNQQADGSTESQQNLMFGKEVLERTGDDSAAHKRDSEGSVGVQGLEERSKRDNNGTVESVQEPMSVDKAMVQACHAFVNSPPDEPKVGMVFGSPDEAFEFYKIYSRKIGFGVTRRTSHTFYGIKYDVTFACNKNRKPTNGSSDEGFGSRSRGILGTGCRAKIVIRDRFLRGSWTIEEVVAEHNHELTPDCVRLMRCHRELPLFVKKQLEINELAGLAQKKSITAVFTQAGGVTNCSFTERDMRNYIAEVRRLQMKDGDAAALMSYFRRQQDKSPYFYSSYDVDDEGRLKNVFWADARSRTAFKYFGDVITFDTTYLTNRYRMPFAAFVGVNHHGQSILLGCALLSNEMTETFEWCFTTFRSCMHGKAPEAIITDQCGSICGAIETVFKETRHRLCLWHILKKLPEKLAGVANKDQVIQTVCIAVYDSVEQSEFDSRWLQLFEKFDLGKNWSWFEELYGIKHKWVPAYVKNHFWAGMSTTQRSEGMNAFFDSYVNSKTSLKSFVDKYDTALHSKWEKERQEDFRCKDLKPKLVTDLAIEKQFAEVYTLKLFYQYQNELKFLMTSYCELVSQRGSVMEYIVGEMHVVRKYNVEIDYLSREYTCSCKLFEFRGIVCRHALTVCKQTGVEMLPDKYVLNRWRKDYLRSHIRQSVPELPIERDISAYNETYATANQLLLDMIELASRSKCLHQFLIQRLNILKMEVIKISEDEYVGDESGLLSSESDASNCSVKDPLVVRGKGRPRSNRFKAGIEKAYKKKRRNESNKGACQIQVDDSKCEQAGNKQQLSTAGLGAQEKLSATELLIYFHANCN